MNSQTIPLIYTLQPAYHDADIWIDQLLNKPDTINWQSAFTEPLNSDLIGACIFDVDNTIGIIFYEKFFTLKVGRISKNVPGKPYVYQFEYVSTYKPEDVMVMEVRNSDGTLPFPPHIVIVNK